MVYFPSSEFTLSTVFILSLCSREDIGLANALDKSLPSSTERNDENWPNIEEFLTKYAFRTPNYRSKIYDCFFPFVYEICNMFYLKYNINDLQADIFFRLLTKYFQTLYLPFFYVELLCLFL